MTKYTLEEVLEKFKAAHPSGKYDYKLVNYISNKTKVLIICLIHNLIFQQSPYKHWTKQEGCKPCRSKRDSEKQRKPLAKFIVEANKAHENFYDYGLVEYINEKTHVIIICPKHGQFRMTPDQHLRGEKCKQCAMEESAKKRTKTLEKFIKQATYKHKGFYKYDKVQYLGDKIKVEIECPNHSYFWQSPTHHLQGKGCKKCSDEGKYRKETLCREIFEDFFKKPFTKSRHDWLRNPKTNQNLELDGYNEELKIAFEYNGEQHYMEHRFNDENEDNLEYQQWKDKLKLQKCIEHGVRLITIPYWIKEENLKTYILQHFVPFDLKVGENSVLNVRRI